MRALVLVVLAASCAPRPPEARSAGWSLASGDGKFLAVRVMRAGRLDRMLVVAGDHFLYARNRARDLPAAKSLTELAAGASREQLLAYLDCELSHGSVRGGGAPWQIERSTLPWREGAHLAFVDDLTVDAAGRSPPARRPARPGRSRPTR